jgi:16S rRNA (guanine527-N7)-methyltransferase
MTQDPLIDAPAIEAALREGSGRIGLPLDDARIGRLVDYLRLLARWNQAYNLTAVRDPAAMVPRHLLDSLVVLPHVTAPAIADLGTGPGLPGIPFAIARPGRAVALVESNGKKARFLREAVRRLDLVDVEVVEARAERGPGARPKVAEVVSRALAALPVLCRLAEPWLAPGGRLLAMKGPGWREELVGLPPGWRVEAAHDLVVPGLEAGRHLVILRGPDPADPRPERP